MHACFVETTARECFAAAWTAILRRDYGHDREQGGSTLSLRGLLNAYVISGSREVSCHSIHLADGDAL